MTDLSIDLLTSVGQVQAHHQRWNELAGLRPQLRWEWLGSWADHYCREKELMVLIVRDQGQIVGIAPWYADQPHFSGRTIRFLGSGSVCTDHLTLLCEPSRENDVASAVGRWLLSIRDTSSRLAQWSHLQLAGVDADDATMLALIETLVDAGATCDRSPGLSCYGIELPDTMEEYVRRRSKSGRRECKKIQDLLSDDRIEIVTVQSRDDVPSRWYEFVDLHQQRQQASGNPGCFEHVPFGEFLFDASEKLAMNNQLRMTFALMDGQPIAAQHAIVSEDRWMFYQSGMNPSCAQYKPGGLVLYATIQQAIQEGKSYFDMMRGDESYKQRWRAEPIATQEIRVAAPTKTAYIQQRAWQWRRAIKTWAKQRRTAVAQ